MGQVDILPYILKFVVKKIINPNTNESRVKRIKIQYDMIPKYYRECKIQWNEEQDYRLLQQELMKRESISEENN